MLTAHLPSGYLLSRALPAGPAVLPAALAGAVFPDLDMIWFLWVDNGAIHHHRYWVHVPLFWLAIAAVALPLVWRSRWRAAAVGFLLAILVHLVLDSIGGGIMWGAPVSERLIALVEVPASHGHWIVSFLLHWTFVLELAVWAAAAWFWLRRPK